MLFFMISKVTQGKENYFPSIFFLSGAKCFTHSFANARCNNNRLSKMGLLFLAQIEKYFKSLRMISNIF